MKILIFETWTPLLRGLPEFSRISRQWKMQNQLLCDVLNLICVYILFWLHPWWDLSMFSRRYNKSNNYKVSAPGLVTHRASKPCVIRIHRSIYVPIQMFTIQISLFAVILYILAWPAAYICKILITCKYKICFPLNPNNKNYSCVHCIHIEHNLISLCSENFECLRYLF